MVCPFFFRLKNKRKFVSFSPEGTVETKEILISRYTNDIRLEVPLYFLELMSILIISCEIDAITLLL